MKAILKKITFPAVALFCLGFAACDDNEQKINYNILLGDELYFPKTDYEVDLGTRASTTFEWAPSIAEDGKFVTYTVLFDRVDGDFSNPLRAVASQLTGSENYLTLTAKELNRVTRAAGLDKKETATFKWTVHASKGLFGKNYSQANTITITSMNAMNPLPAAVTLEGNATEDPVGGIPMVLSDGIDGVKAEEGTFECFTQLTAGGTFTVTDDLGRYYALNSDGTMTDSATPVANTMADGAGIYWIKAEFNGMSWTHNKISQVVLYAAAWSNGFHTAKTPMTYAGKGVWELLDYDNATSGNADKDSRHRFNMTLDDGSTLYLGHSAAESGPKSYTAENMKVHLFTSETIGNVDWNRTYKLLDSDCGRPFDCYLYMNGDNSSGIWFHEKRFK